MAKYTNIKILAILLFIAGCSQHNQTSDNMHQPAENGEIVVTRDQMNEMGLEVGNLQKATVSEGVAVNGYLDTPPLYKANVSSIIGGRITGIRFLQGDYVSKGQEVVRMESPDFLRLQQDFIEAR